MTTSGEIESFIRLNRDMNLDLLVLAHAYWPIILITKA
jgi:hypothetical protein